MLVQAGLCQTCSETTLLVFPRGGSNHTFSLHYTEAEQDEETRMDIMFDRLMLMELRENVAKIDSKAFAELRSYIDPPRIVHDILKAVCAIFHPQETEEGAYDDWTQMKGVNYCRFGNVH